MILRKARKTPDRPIEQAPRTVKLCSFHLGCAAVRVLFRAARDAKLNEIPNQSAGQEMALVVSEPPLCADALARQVFDAAGNLPEKPCSQFFCPAGDIIEARKATQQPAIGAADPLAIEAQ